MHFFIINFLFFSEARQRDYALRILCFFFSFFVSSRTSRGVQIEFYTLISEIFARNFWYTAQLCIIDSRVELWKKASDRNNFFGWNIFWVLPCFNYFWIGLWCGYFNFCNCPKSFIFIGFPKISQTWFNYDVNLVIRNMNIQKI